MVMEVLAKRVFKRRENEEPYGGAEGPPEDAGDQQGEFHVGSIWKERI